MSIKTIISLILGGSLFLGVYLGYNYVVDLQEKVETQSVDIASLTISNKILEKEKEQFKQDLVDSNKRAETINKKFKESRKKADELEKLFANHDFAKLIKSKPQWMEKKINKGTKEVLQDLENVSK